MKIDVSWYKKPKGKNIPTSISTGGIVIRVENTKPLIGLIRDPEFSDYLLPKGRLEKNEDLEDAARREISEETGIKDLSLIRKLGVKERLTFKKNEWKITHYFLFFTKQKNGMQNLQDEENYVFEWFDLENLPLFFWKEQKDLVLESRRIILKLLQDYK